MARARSRAPRLDPAARRRQLLDAALAVADERGFAGLTVDAVARRAGVTRPVVYDQFEHYAGLLGALIDDAEERALAAVGLALPDVTGDPDPAEVFEQAIGAFLGAVHAEPALWRLVLAPPESAPAAVRERYRAQRAAIVEHIAGILDWWVGRVDALAELDRGILARTMIAVFEDAARLALEHPDRYPADRLARGAAQFARLVELDR